MSGLSSAHTDARAWYRGKRAEYMQGLKAARYHLINGKPDLRHHAEAEARRYRRDLAILRHVMKGHSDMFGCHA